MIRMLCMGRARHPGDRRLPHVRAMHHVFTAVKATCETLTNSPLQAKKTQARRVKRPDTVTRHLLDRFIGLANRWPANPPSEGQACSAKPDPKDRTKVTSDSRPSPRKEADRLSTRRASDDARAQADRSESPHPQRETALLPSRTHHGGPKPCRHEIGGVTSNPNSIFHPTHDEGPCPHSEGIEETIYQNCQSWGGQALDPRLALTRANLPEPDLIQTSGAHAHSGIKASDTCPVPNLKGSNRLRNGDHETTPIALKKALGSQLNIPDHGPDSQGHEQDREEANDLVALKKAQDHKQSKSEQNSVRSLMKTLLAEFRSENSVRKVREACANSLPTFSVLELATGGCLDSIAAILSGFRHLGGTEDVSRPLGRLKARLFEDLTGERCLGDTTAWKEWISCVKQEVDYLKAGQPCPDYSSAGSGLGAGGQNGGELFVKQLEPILALNPKVVRLEMVPNALHVNGGAEVALVKSTLSKHYHVHESVLECWRHGDPSVRQRLFIVALRRDLFSEEDWTWPEQVLDETCYPIARDIAVPDSDVHPRYRRSGSIITYKEPDPVQPGRIQHVGFAGDPERPEGMGSCKNPPRVTSWDGGFPTQLSTNGGTCRPLLEWRQGWPIVETRMTVPTETLRAASLHEESYTELAQKHFCRKTLGMSLDMFIRELVNLGVPVQTSKAIDQQVLDVLKKAHVRPTDQHTKLDKCTAFAALGTDEYDKPCDGLMYPSTFGTAMLSKAVGLGATEMDNGIADTGATDHLFDSKFSSFMYDTRPATASYQTAGQGSIHGDVTGSMDISVLNLSHHPECPPSVDQTLHVTTVKGLGPSLYSLEAEYRDKGYDIHLSHGYKKGDYTGLYRPNTPEAKRYGPESFIPLVYDHEGSGGWRVPFIVRHPSCSDEQHKARLQSVLEQNETETFPSKRVSAALKQHTYSVQKARDLERYYWACPAVSQMISVRVPGERTIRPAFSYGGLRRYKNKTWHQLHSDWAHMGEPGQPCSVCNMFKGAPRNMPKHTKGKPREIRPGHSWHMDMIHFRYRSDEGCKYLVILTDEATQFKQLIPLHWKTDAVSELERWVTALRGHPALQDLDYVPISHIYTDNESVWDEYATAFNAFVDRTPSLLIDYADPSDHARDNAMAEGANKIIEAGIQSLLYEKNLPPSWWQKAADDVMFLINRLPPYSMDAAVPIDGEVPAPVTKLLHGFISQHQVYRELDSYVPVGTPALCHLPKVKGSDLEPKVRWGIATGRRGKVTRWMCPFSKGIRFMNRSFTAFGLRTGLNWSQFLGLGDIAPKEQSRMFPQSETEDEAIRVIQLPAVRANSTHLPPPVAEVAEGSDDGSIIRATCGRKGDESGLCEYFPRIKQTKIHASMSEVNEFGEPESGLEDQQAGSLPLEGEDDPREIIPPLDAAAEAATPKVRVINSKGEKVVTRPFLDDPITRLHPRDEDNLFVEGCDVSAIAAERRKKGWDSRTSARQQ